MTIANRFGHPDLGLGIGLRTVHFGHIVEHWPKLDFFEIISENFMETEGRPLWFLDRIRERYPIDMHGVAMGIGTTDPIDFTYLKKLKALADRIGATWLGDHVCWTGVRRLNGHDLYPLPYNEKTLKHFTSRVKTIQDYIERPLVLENPSTYVTFRDSTMAEEEWIARMAEDADCALLLDVNNIYVTARNHDLDPFAYLEKIPWDRVSQIHLAGHTDNGTHCIDTHDGKVVPTVWKLYAEAMRRAGPRATLVEWDDRIPSFDEVRAEVKKAAKYRKPAEAAHGT